MEKIELICNENIRIDKFISENCEDISRSYAAKLIEDGNVLVDGNKISKHGLTIKSGSAVEVLLPPPEFLQIVPQNIPIDIVYEDEYLLVVNKPQGMVVHPAAGNYEGTLVNALMAHCGDNLSQINGVIRPGIVHRIDKDTSGLLLVAKSNVAHLGLAEQIKEHSLKRHYIAIVYGNIKEDNGRIDLPIGRHKSDRKKMAVTYKNSKNAVTNYSVLERFNGYTFVECRLETGRTHQIRVHFSHFNHPIVGDVVYGPKKDKFSLNGQLLHAREIGFIHPISGEYLDFQTEIPQRFIDVMKRLR